MIKEVEGNLLDEELDIIAHQVNCLGIMGAGIALQIKNKYPEVYKEYKRASERIPMQELLGRSQIIFVEREGKFVANIFSQQRIGKGRQTNYEALKEGLIELKNFAKKNNYSVGLPYKIGCGLAGGDWGVVRKIIDQAFYDYEVTIVKLKQKEK